VPISERKCIPLLPTLRAALFSPQMVSRFCMLLPLVEKPVFTVSFGPGSTTRQDASTKKRALASGRIHQRQPLYLLIFSTLNRSKGSGMRCPLAYDADHHGPKMSCPNRCPISHRPSPNYAELPQLVPT
jgi:hypothetical protein